MPTNLAYRSPPLLAVEAVADYLDNPRKYSSMSAAGRKHNVDERNLSQVSREVTRLKKLRAAVAAHAGTTVEELCNDGTVVEDMDLDDDQEEELLEGNDKKQWTAAWHHGVAE